MKTISRQLQRMTQGAMLGLLCIAVSPANAQINTLPSNDPLSGRKINVTRGLSSLGEIGVDTFSVSIEVPCESSPCNAATQSNLVIRIFDGDMGGEWDVVPGSGADEMAWSLFPDPLTIANDTNPLVDHRNANTFPDNAFEFLYNGPHSPLAICDSEATCGAGKVIRNAFVYHLDLTWILPTKTNEQNNFMANVCKYIGPAPSDVDCNDSTAGKAFLISGSTIGFIGYGPVDPFFPTTSDTTYNGTFTFFAQVKNIPGEATCRLDIYTGDTDRADDTDDLNSPVLADIPFPIAPVTQEQGTWPGIPKDDAGPASPFRQSPSVYFQVQGPAGSYLVTDSNPSGDKEWELFRIASAHPDCTTPLGPGVPNPKDYTGGNPANGLPDVLVPQILEGDHKISFIGLDARNTVFMTVSEEVTGAPTIECGECEGKVTQLTLRYDGPPLPGNIAVIQGRVDGSIDTGGGTGKGKGKGKGGQDGKGTVLFDGPVAPGGLFSFIGANSDGTMGPEISVCVEVDICLRVHTSCSQPIGPGEVFTDGTHTLTVDTAYSRRGGLMCVADETLASPSGETCTDNKPLHSLSMIWNGAEAVNIEAWDGAVGGTSLGTQNNITPGTEVTVSGYSDSSPNDVFWEIFSQSTGSKVGNSTFHLSCSDPGMDGPEDCGQPEGNGKDAKPIEPNLVNDWLLAGYSNLAGPGLDCTP